VSNHNDGVKSQMAPAQKVGDAPAPKCVKFVLFVFDMPRVTKYLYGVPLFASSATINYNTLGQTA